MAELVTERDIALAIEKLGLSGKPVCIHSSLRSFGWVEGEPRQSSRVFEPRLHYFGADLLLEVCRSSSSR